MAQRRHHYEQAFEHYLRWRRVPYVAVDEARKALLPSGAGAAAGGVGGVGGVGGGGGGGGVSDPVSKLKSFDFVLYGPGGNLLVEIKGRRIGGRRACELPARAPPLCRPRGRLESWVTLEDVESLGVWERLFGEGFTAGFVFVYWCESQPPAALFEEIFEFHGRWYALREVDLAGYAAAMRPRSARWGTVHLAGAEFDRLSVPLWRRMEETGRQRESETARQGGVL